MVERSLIPVGSRPSHMHELRASRLEQWCALGIDRGPLFGADHKRRDTLLSNGVVSRESVSVQQAHQSAEVVGLALMRRRREQEHRGCRLGQRLAEPMSSDPVSTASQAVGFVDDDEIPTGGHKVLESLAVVGADSLRCPTAPSVDRLDCIQRADHLIVELPQVALIVDARELAPSGKVSGNDRPEILVEVRTHFGYPLRDEARWRDHEYALGQAAQLEFAQD